MVILGLDPGYATIGYGVIDKSGSKITPLDYGVITTPASENLPMRLGMIDEAMTALMNKYSPYCVSIEELFFNTNITTGIKVAEARGVIVLNAIKGCGRLFEYTPLQIKQALTGNGRATKQQMQYMVKMVLGLSSVPKPDDAADALAAAICHSNMMGNLKREVS